ncbi:MAG: hypothetical protein HY692_00920, partial [Cyanobacteria bacterium NC_groundwater_1444_Ag_S-0.65um_54_12]|nr:hypothetical protein [Cyanobacteria bacterium NC_groundwater_1444_Ag_S-0.65um_54_12]
KELPNKADVYVVQAKFSANGKDFVFRTLTAVSPQATATVAVDASSTLVSEKLKNLVRRQQLAGNDFDQSAYDMLVSLLQTKLSNENIPYMAANAKDMLAVFDQLLLDSPELQDKATKLAPAISEPSEQWQVSKLLDSNDLVAGGIIMPASRSILYAAGAFEVDANGNLYLPVARDGTAAATLDAATGGSTGSIYIVRITPEGKVEPYAKLPPNIANPVMLAFSPQGDLHVLGHDPKTLELLLFSGRGDLQRRPGNIFKLDEVRLADLPGRFLVDSNGTVFMAMRDYHAIIRQTRVAPTEVFAGGAGTAGYKDDSKQEARFSFPASVTLGPDGAVYVADLGNNCLRRVGQDGMVSTAAGKPGEQIYRNGRGAYARFGTPESIAVDFEGNMFITDPYSKRIRRLSPEGSVFLVAGSGQDGVVDGPGPQAQFHNPSYLTVDRLGNLYVLDRLPDQPGKPYTEVIRKISKRSS